MATLSILLADATIIVNSNEDDEAIKEILPIVLLAYRGSKFAEQMGGRLSSMVFFVYNRVNTMERHKLSSTVQTLAATLREAFDTVSELSGPPNDLKESASRTNTDDLNPMSLFRGFKLDTSSDSSDVRILGVCQKGCMPPDNVPDPAYGEALVQFREYIHNRVTESKEWQSRSLSEFLEYLDLVWLCIQSADFTLSFTSVMERAAYGKLNAEYKTCEKELADEYYRKFGDIERKILEKKITAESIDRKMAMDFEGRLQTEVIVKQNALDNEVEMMVEKPGRAKWKTYYEIMWKHYKEGQKRHWEKYLRMTSECQLNFNLRLDEYKKSMRNDIRTLFSANGSADSWSERQNDVEFGNMYAKYLDQAKKEYPSLDVPQQVRKIYASNPSIQELQIQLFDAPSTSGPKGWIARSKYLWNGLVQAGKPNNAKVETELTCAIESYLADKVCYFDSLVNEVIEITIQITRKHMCHYTDIQEAHKCAMGFLIQRLTAIQRKWDSENSISVKLTQKETVEEMSAYFHAASEGIVGTQLFICMLRNNLSAILPEAFPKEVVKKTDAKLRSKAWVYDPKVLQAHIDLYLIELLDAGEVDEVLCLLRRGDSLWKTVLDDLVKDGLPDLQKEKEFFQDLFSSAIHQAAASSRSVKKARVKTFIESLHKEYLDRFHDRSLFTKLTTDSAGYDFCDDEDEEEFARQCESLSTLPEEVIRDCDLAPETLVDDVLTFMRDVHRDDVSRPRCGESCPLCGSICIHPANHLDAIKHDCFHQPDGIVGGYWSESCPTPELRRTLSHQTCSMMLEQKAQFWMNDKFNDYEDFSKLFPEWVNPHLAERLPLREYIFANYHEKIARRFGLLPCIDIPESYQHDLDSIRERLTLYINAS